MKLRSPAKPISSRAFATANVRSPESRSTADTRGLTAPTAGAERCSRTSGQSATVVSRTTEPATTNGSGRHSARKNPPASSATPSPTPRKIPWLAWDLAYRSRGSRSAYRARYGG